MERAVTGVGPNYLSDGALSPASRLSRISGLGWLRLLGAVQQDQTQRENAQRDFDNPIQHRLAHELLLVDQRLDLSHFRRAVLVVASRFRCRRLFRSAARNLGVETRAGHAVCEQSVRTLLGLRDIVSLERYAGRHE